MKYMVQTGMLPGRNYMEKYQAAAKIGFDAVELTSYDGRPINELADELNDAAQKTGICARVLCGGYSGWIGDFDVDKRNQAIADISMAMAVCGRLGIEGMIAPAAYGMHSNCLPPHKAPRTRSEDQTVLCESLSRIAEAAEKHGVYLYLEPLNRYEDHMLNTMQQAVEMISNVGSSYIRAMIDLFHGSIEEANLGASCSKYASYIKHVHLADSNRLLPGLGHTDFKAIFNSLMGNGFDGYMSYECGFAGAGDALSELTDSLKYLKSL